MTHKGQQRLILSRWMPSAPHIPSSGSGTRLAERKGRFAVSSPESRLLFSGLQTMMAVTERPAVDRACPTAALETSQIQGSRFTKTESTIGIPRSEERRVGKEGR